MRVAMVVGDIGATKELIPAAKELEKHGHQVTWIADQKGKGGDLLLKEGIPFVTGDDFGDYDVIVIGTSATAVNRQIEWTRHGKETGITVIWYEDLWGTGERPVTQLVSPDVMLTISKTASTIVRHVRPDIQVEVVGKPSFGRLSNINLNDSEEYRTRIRGELGIKDDEAVVLYWGGGEEERVKVHLEALMGIKEVNSRRVVFLPRLHPKMPGRNDLWSSLKTCSNVVDAHSVDEVALNCAADVVVGEFGSTQTFVAPLLGTYSFIALWPDNIGERKGCGLIDGKPVQIECKVATGVTSSEEIKGYLAWWLQSKSRRRNLWRTAHEAFGDVIRPGAAKRITEAIVRYAGQ